QDNSVGWLQNLHLNGFIARELVRIEVRCQGDPVILGRRYFRQALPHGPNRAYDKCAQKDPTCLHVFLQLSTQSYKSRTCSPARPYAPFFFDSRTPPFNTVTEQRLVANQYGISR